MSTCQCPRGMVRLVSAPQVRAGVRGKGPVIIMP